MEYVNLVFNRNGCNFVIAAQRASQDANIDVLAEALADTFGATYIYKEEVE